MVFLSFINFLPVGQVDDMHVAVSPVLLGEGERLFSGMNLDQLGYTVTQSVAVENANARSH